MAKKPAKKRNAAPARAKPRGPAGNWHMDWDPFVKLDPAWTEKVLGMVISPTVAGAHRREDHPPDRPRDRRFPARIFTPPGIRRHIQRAPRRGRHPRRADRGPAAMHAAEPAQRLRGRPDPARRARARGQASRLNRNRKENACNSSTTRCSPKTRKNWSSPSLPTAPSGSPRTFPEDIPVTMDEHVQKAVDCYNAGATVLHIHVREEDGKGSKRLSEVQRAERAPQGRGARHDPAGGRLRSPLSPEGEGADAKVALRRHAPHAGGAQAETRAGDDRAQHHPDERDGDPLRR